MILDATPGHGHDAAAHHSQAAAVGKAGGLESITGNHRIVERGLCAIAQVQPHAKMPTGTQLIGLVIACAAHTGIGQRHRASGSEYAAALRRRAVVVNPAIELDGAVLGIDAAAGARSGLIVSSCHLIAEARVVGGERAAVGQIDAAAIVGRRVAMDDGAQGDAGVIGVDAAPIVGAVAVDVG